MESELLSFNFEFINVFKSEDNMLNSSEMLKTFLKLVLFSGSVGMFEIFKRISEKLPSSF